MDEKKQSYIINAVIEIAAIIGETIVSGNPFSLAKIPSVFAFLKHTSTYVLENGVHSSSQKKKIEKINQELFNIMLKTPILDSYKVTQKHNYIEMTIKNYFTKFDINNYEKTTIHELKSDIKNDVKKIFNTENNINIVTEITFYTVCAIYAELTPNKEIKLLIYSLIDIESRLEKIETAIFKTPSIKKLVTQCSENFTDPLYLHKDIIVDNSEPKKIVNLNNLYVDPYIKNIRKHTSSSVKALDFLSSDFNHSRKSLILLGDAGSGKTSLISKLAYLYCKSKNEYLRDRIFNGAELVIVRLRYIDKTQIQNGQLYRAICNELNVDWLDKNAFDGKFVILDGLDELSSYNSENNFNSIIDQLKEGFKYSYRVIITSRPGVVNVNSIDDNCDVYTIIPFNNIQKKNWIEKYETTTNSEISKEIRRYILSKDDADGKSIFDYPQLMYMIASATPKEGIWSLDNKWSIYHHIFYNEILQRNYEDDPVERPSEKIKIALYNLLQCIAFDMYTKDSITKLNKNDIYNIIKDIDDSNMSTPEDIESAFSKFGYRFGCYWNIVNNDLEIEFYHNNIRDFFIAEYIYNALNTLIKPCLSHNFFDDLNKPGNRYLKKSNKYEILGNKLFKLFRGVPIHKEVADFIVLRTTFKNRHLDSDNHSEEPFASFIKTHLFCEASFHRIDNPLKLFMDELSTNLNIYKPYDSYSEYSSIQKIGNFLNNFISIIYAISNELDNTYKVQILSDPSNPKLFNSTYFNSKYNRYINLSRANLDHFEMNEMYLSYAHLENTSLCGANLKYIILSYANLKNATILDAKLYNANLQNSDLTETFFSSSDLTCSNLTSAKLYKTKFVNSTLSYAKINNIKESENVDFSDAILQHATFLNSVLENADFSDTDLSNADFSNSNIRGATFINATLNDVVWVNADIYGANFSNTRLSLSEIKRAKNWEFAIYDNTTYLDESSARDIPPARTQRPFGQDLPPCI